MKSKTDVENKLIEALTTQIKDLEELKGSIKITFEETINIDCLNKYNCWDELYCILQEKLKAFPKESIAIYIIKSGSKPDYEKLLKKRKEIKENFAPAISRINTINKDSIRENCIYVGQSKNLVNRLKQHFFQSAQWTYSLRLNKLLNNEKISIDIYGFDNDSNEVQLFEDILWDWYKPLFGKKGS